ncbi:restriction endonuclease subunit S [Bacillus sp. Marseille-Q3570]|uniref:restriction endonuclease subunit S n=1 Tax=Bacillus sp. Marseille-Q3570 TaxID=2963522 RepID=UPI0021B83EE8|nr:restriction endonuclease subunit S [Bacillus sp. Marseille-Q3570]
MKSNWPEVKIEELLADKKNAIAMGPFGSRIKTENFVASGIPIIKGQNLTKGWLNEEEFSYLTKDKAEELKSSAVERGDLVFTHRGTLGQVGYIHENSKFPIYIVSQSQMKLSVNPQKVLPLFLYYFFKSKLGQHRLLLNKSQTGVPAIARPTSSLKKIEVPLPPLEVQVGIVNILKKLEEKINNNNLIIPNLEKLVQILFKRWFIEYEFPNQNGEPYNSSGGNLRNSELGLIPATWEVVPVSNIASILSGGTPKTRISEYWDGNIPFYTPKDSSSNYYVNVTEKMITESGLNKCNSKLYHKNTIFITARGTVGKLNLAASDMAMNQSCYALIHNEKYQYYLFLVMKNLVRQIVHSSNGAVFNAITKRDFNTFKIADAPKKVIEKFEKIVKPIFEEIATLQLENNKLINLRDTLLPQLFSGEVTIPDESEELQHVQL